MTTSARILVGKAETEVGKLKNGNAHPDDINRAQAATQLALAASSVELTTAINDLLKSTNASTGGIKKIVDAVTKSVNGLTAKL
ncbi:hypothetical protein [Streptomyces sp. NPDC055400]